MDIWDGIIVGTAASVIGAIIVYKFLGHQPEGGGTPNQPAMPSYNATSGGAPAPLYVVDLNPTPLYAAPVQQTNPITEAAYSVGPVPFEHAFGPAVNQPTTEDNTAVMPM